MFRPGTKEDQVAVRCRAAANNLRDNIVGQKLEYRGVQAFSAAGNRCAFDIGETFGTEARDIRRVIVYLLAAEAAALRNPQSCHPPVRVVGGCREHFEFHLAQQIAELAQLQWDAQIRAVAAVALHGIGVAHAWKIRQFYIQHTAI